MGWSHGRSLGQTKLSQNPQANLTASALGASASIPLAKASHVVLLNLRGMGNLLFPQWEGEGSEYVPSKWSEWVFPGNFRKTLLDHVWCKKTGRKEKLLGDASAMCEILQIRILLISGSLPLRTCKLFFVYVDWALLNGNSPWDWPYGVMASIMSHNGSNYCLFYSHNRTPFFIFGYFRPFMHFLMVLFLFLPLVEKHGQWLPNCDCPSRDTVSAGNGSDVPSPSRSKWDRTSSLRTLGQAGPRPRMRAIRWVSGMTPKLQTH